MGTMHHHAVIVTSWNEDMIAKAHAVAAGLSPHVTPIITATSNGQQSFAILPDGSKAGWAESDVGDAARGAFLTWVDSRAYEDGSNALSYAEVSFGELAPTIKTNTT